MRYLLLLLLLTGCTLNTPISQFDAGITELCTDGQHEYTHEGDTVRFYVHTTEDTDQIFNWCGPDASACIRGQDVYVPAGRSCPSSMAHELNHLFGNDWVDMPRVGNHWVDAH